MSDRAVCIVKHLEAEGRKHPSLPARQGKSQGKLWPERQRGQRSRCSESWGSGWREAGRASGMILHADSRLLTCTGLMEPKERSPILTIQNEGGGEREVGGATGFLR